MHTHSRFSVTLVAAALLLGSGLVRAHHSMVAEFSQDKPLTLRGTLTQMEWVNPHGWIYLDVKGAGGRVENWKIETGAPARMVKRGLNKTDFKVGDELIVGAFAAKDGSKSGAGWIVTFVNREKAFPAQEATFPLGR